MKKLYLVDVSSMFFRAFYAIRPLTSASGMPTNAIYGFVSMTVKLLREIRPDYMAFCFDRPEPSFRRDLDPRYKANRSEMPADLVPQVPYIRRVSEALGVACFDRLGFEADDLIGTLTKWGREHELEVVIVSGDKDFGQLVRPFVGIYDTMKEIRYDEAGVVEKWGVAPSQMIDYLALVGDSSDNVAGVKGIGPKGAQSLLAEFKSIEQIYENVDRIESKALRQKLIAGREEAFLSKKLVTIVDDIPLGVSPDDLRLKPIHRPELQALLEELDFKSFARTLLGASAGLAAQAPAQGMAHAQGATPAPPESTAASGQGTGSDFGSRPGSSSGPGGFVRQASEELKSEIAASLAAASVSTVSASVSTPSSEALVEKKMDMGAIDRWLKPGSTLWGFHTERGVLLAQGDTVVEVEGEWFELGKLLSAKQLQWKGFDVKGFWKAVGLKAPEVGAPGGGPVVWDQMLAAYVIRAGPIEKAAPLMALYSGMPLPELPSPAQLYAAHLRLEANLRMKIADLRAENILEGIELPLVSVLYEMEEEGILIDRAALGVQSGELARALQILEREIHIEAGEVFNVGSPKQLGRILFEKLKIPALKKTKTGYSTDNEVLEKIAPLYPIGSKVLDYREIAKLRSTYVDALPALARRDSDRVHTTFNQAQTTTGRLSSTNPNLQNIPIRTERGARIRKAFIARPGHCLISADYSQIELRILAHITSDPGLSRAFSMDTDIHAATASEIFSIPLTEVTGEHRRRAKAVNFGLAYGQGAFGLAETLRISRTEAAEVIERYFARFSGVRQYMEETVKTAKTKGFVETIFGRRRYIDELFSKSAAVRKFGERAAINAPIQGTAADIVKKAMVEARRQVDAKMILQVHDELVFEAPSDRAGKVTDKAKVAMEGVVSFNVPLKVNVAAGRDWEEAHR